VNLFIFSLSEEFQIKENQSLAELSDTLDRNIISKMLKEAEIGFWIQELDKWEIIWTNEKFSTILNLASSDIIGSDVREFFNKSAIGFLTSFMSYKPKIFETKGINSGIDTDIQIAVGTIENKYLYGVIRDITREKQAYHALRASEKRLKALIEATRAGMVVTNPEGLIVFSNQAFANLVGFNSPTELNGLKIGNFITQHEMLLSLDKFVSMKILQKTGKSKDILISVDPVITGKRKSESVGFIADLSWTLSNQLKRENLLNEFLQITVHEMGTPITLLKGFIELLIKSYDEKQVYSAAIIDALLRNTKKLERQLNALRDVQDAKDGLLSIEKTLIWFKELETSIKSDINLLKGSSRIKIKMRDTRDSHDQFYLDLDRITQVIFNLLENACHHSPKDSDIDLSIILGKESLDITVLDRGVGISEEKLNRVFEPFFSEATKYYKKGMGLGLFVTKTIVDKHEGKISIDSKLGKGSEFSVIVPI
jgi:PAS domain S-box-containing protein